MTLCLPDARLHDSNFCRTTILSRIVADSTALTLAQLTFRETIHREQLQRLLQH